MKASHPTGWRRNASGGWEDRSVGIGGTTPCEWPPPNYPGEVANRFRYADGSGEVGVIASVTQPFCGGCTRARLSAEGRLYTCLFAVRGHDLREPLRDRKSTRLNSSH